MGVVLFLLFSMIEWSTVFVLTFSIFMFRIKENTVNIIFWSALLSMFSYIVRDVANLTLISVILQLIVVFLIIWLLLRVPPIYAGVMATLGYISYGFIQTIIMMLLHWSSIISMDDINTNQYNLDYTLLYISSTIMSYVLSIIFIKNRIGFSFVPDTLVKIGLRGNIKLFIVILLAAFTCGILLFSYEHGFLQWVFWSMTIVTISLVYLLFKKEISS